MKQNIISAIEIAEETNTHFSQLTEEEQKLVVQMLKTFVDGKILEQDEVDIAQYNKDVDESLTEFEKGEFYTHEEVAKSTKNI